MNKTIIIAGSIIGLFSAYFIGMYFWTQSQIEFLTNWGSTNSFVKQYNASNPLAPGITNTIINILPKADSADIAWLYDLVKAYDAVSNSGYSSMIPGATPPSGWSNYIALMKQIPAMAAKYGIKLP